MPVINHAKKEIHAKIVYLGPPGAGKRTSVSLIHSRLKPESRSELKVMGEGARSALHFSFLPHELGSVDGYRVRFHLYALDALAAQEETLKMVLKGADGIMFVADASPERLADNGASLELVADLLALSGSGFRDLPVLAQINRKDLLPQGGGQELMELLSGCGLVFVFSDAVRSEGVLEAVARLVKGIMQRLRQGGVLLSELQMPQEEPEVEQSPRELEAPPAVSVSLESSESSAAAGEAGWSLEGGGEVRSTEGGHLSIPVVLAGPRGERFHLAISLAVTAEEP